MPQVSEKTKNRAGKERRCGRAGCGKVIEPGEKYLSWSFRYGGTQFRCMAHPPRQSELTQSKMSAVYAAIEHAEDQLAYAESVEDVKALVETVAGQVEETAEEYRDAAEAMGAAGEENEDRASELDDWAQELQGFDPDEGEEEGARRSAAERKYLFEALSPEAMEEEGIASEDDLPEDDIEFVQLMTRYDVDQGDAMTEFVDAEMSEGNESVLEEAREEASDLLGQCPL